MVRELATFLVGLIVAAFFTFLALTWDSSSSVIFLFLLASCNIATRMGVITHNWISATTPVSINDVAYLRVHVVC